MSKNSNIDKIGDKVKSEKISDKRNKDDKNTDKTLSHYNMNKYKDIELSELLDIYNTRDYSTIVKSKQAQLLADLEYEFIMTSRLHNNKTETQGYPIK